jgi:ABC-type phosphate transport system permease subunit
VELARFGLSVFGAFGLLAATLAGAAIWLLLAHPVTVADAIRDGEVSPLVKALAGAIYDALSGLLRFL